MSITTIEHKGKTIYYNDWRNLKSPEDFEPKIKEGDKNTKELINSGKNDILTLTDITGSFVFGDIVQMLREAGKLAKSITKKSATVGLSSAKKIILNSINTFSQAKIKAFDTVEEAKDWLAED